MTGSTISTTVSSEITLGSGAFLSPLTVTPTGRINGPAETSTLQTASAIYVGSGVTGARILNRGQIAGILPQFDSLSIPAILAESALTLNNYGTIVGQSGIYLNAGGTITNSGLIAGSDARSQHDYGVRLVNASLVNSGTIYGAKYGVTNWNTSGIANSGTVQGGLAGVDLISTTLAYGGTLTNQGSIYGKQSGITASGAMITNSGTVTGGTYGIHITWGSTISNSGKISGGRDGVLLLNQQYQVAEDSSLVNSGSISGGYFGLAINFANATNAASGTISGQSFGVGVGETGFFLNVGSVYGVNAGVLPENGGLAVNEGTIAGGSTGAFLFSGSNLTNASGGYIHGGTTGLRDLGGYWLNAGSLTGSSYGVYQLSGGVGVNRGTISSSGEGIYLSSISSTTASNFLINAGTIYGAGAGLILKNGIAYNLGKISGGPIGVSLVAGTSLSNAVSIYGQKYGVQLSAGRVTNTGTIFGKKTGVEISDSYLFTSGTISGGTYAIYGQDMTLGIGPGEVFGGKVTDKTDTSTFDLTGQVLGSLTGLGTTLTGFDEIDIESGAQWFIAGNSAGLASHQLINGFTYGDTILLTGFTMTTIEAVNDSGMILSDGTHNVSLDIAVHFNTSTTPYHITASNLGTMITLPVPCFVAGTRILTPRGAVAVQDLCVGETVITLSGEDRPIIWTGERTIDLLGHPQPSTVRPICIACNALAENVPVRDLWVSPDHAIHIGGYLIPAKQLLNNRNIYQATPASVTYHHIELDTHAIIFAENAEAETYLETGNRAGFADGTNAAALAPDVADLLRRQNSCAVLLESGDALEEIRAGILRRHGRGPARISKAISL